MQRTTNNGPIKNKLGDIVAYSEVAIRNNIAAVEYCRTSIAAISGSAAGLDQRSIDSIDLIKYTNYICRYFRTEWIDWFPILCGFGIGFMVTHHDQIRYSMASLFHQSKKSSHQ